MANLSSVTPYATEAQADTINGTDEPWASATSEAKNASLVNATLYIDQKYTCQPITDPVQQNVIEACSVLANADLASPLFQAQDAMKGPLASESVAAGSVSSSKSYNVTPASGKRDPYPEATALLGQNGVCSYSGFGTVSVTR